MCGVHACGGGEEDGGAGRSEHCAHASLLATGDMWYERTSRWPAGDSGLLSAFSKQSAYAFTYSFHSAPKVSSGRSATCRTRGSTYMVMHHVIGDTNRCTSHAMPSSIP